VQFFTTQINNDNILFKNKLLTIKKELLEFKEYGLNNPSTQNADIETISRNFIVCLHDDFASIDYNSHFLDKLNKRFWIFYNYEKDEYSVSTNIMGLKKYANGIMEKADIEENELSEPIKKLLLSRLKVKTNGIPEYLKK
jgi:hypothetical protein